MKRLLIIFIALWIILSMVSAFADDWPVYNHVADLGYRINDNGTDGVTDRRVMLLENENSQVFGFTENGHSYSVMNLTQYMARFDINDLRRLFYDTFSAYEWDVALYCPDFQNKVTDRYAVTFGLVESVDLSDANYVDPAEYSAALVALFDLPYVIASNDASISLDGMTYDELVALKDRINLAIWNSAEWQEVTVLQGRWIVGEDIPAGKWTVKCADVDNDDYWMSYTAIQWGSDIDINGNISYMGRYGYEYIYNPLHPKYENGNITESVFDFQNNDMIIIENEHAPAVFTPYSGKPSLGFK